MYIWVQYSVEFPPRAKKETIWGQLWKERTPGSDVLNDEGGGTNQKERIVRTLSGRVPSVRVQWEKKEEKEKNKAKGMNEVILHC